MISNDRVSCRTGSQVCVAYMYLMFNYCVSFNFSLQEEPPKSLEYQFISKSN